MLARVPHLGDARSMLWLTGVEGGARLLSFVFYIMAARVLAPSGFGVVQYTITVATLAFGGLQVAVTALIRELGAARHDEARIQEMLGSSLVLAAGLLLSTSLLCIVAQLAGLASAANTLGLLAVLAGMTGFQIYYGVSRGLGDARRQAASYLGASFAQLVAFGALVIFAHPGPTAALLVFGLSSFAPVVLYEWRKPVLRGQSLRVSPVALRKLWVLAAPLLVAQIAYLLWNSLDQLWVQKALGTYQVGLYASAKNISQAMLVIPGGVSGVLLPRLAQFRTSGHPGRARSLMFWGTVGAVGLSAVVAATISVVRVPLLGALYGHSYLPASGPLAVLCLGMVFASAFATLTIAAVGWGRPGVFTFGVAVAAASEAAILVITGGHTLMTAAIAYAASSAIAALSVVILLHMEPLRGVRFED
jgi:O-antigen/teichoic acid export membrane protein